MDFDAFFDYANWTVGLCWGFDDMIVAQRRYRAIALCLGPLVLVAAYPAND
jgi:hypothetical protein